MAERTTREGLPPTRRQSFRRIHADAGLPDEYLEQLEQKRKQLDESIHKYIASKERDFKIFERDLRLQYKQDKQEQIQDGSKASRMSAEATDNGAGSPQLRAPQESQSAVDAMLAAGVNREHIGQPLSIALVDGDGSPRLEAKSAAGLIDRRASIERDKEFVGVFTPAFLPALENKADPKTQSLPERAESAPPAHGKEAEQPTVLRAYSDHAVQAKGKRPVQLQLAHRTSSSGSSADGKLTSALKSPIQGPRSKRKRVSLAVGDSIVKPSDSVPTSLLNNNRAPSHSRKRSQSTEAERQSIDATMANGSGTKDIEVPALTPPSPQGSADIPAEPIMVPQVTNEHRLPAVAPVSNGKSTAATATSSPLSRTPAQPSRNIDPDGDLFDLEEEEMAPNGRADAENFSESEDDITGRVDREFSPEGISDSGADFSSEAEVEDDTAEHVEFIPGSANASQQPTNPGFRRPSATNDPIYAGANYDRVEHSAVVNEIYSSSSRPATKSSFTSGSLGESFMARNAQHMRARSGNSSHEQTEVRS